MSIEKFFYSSPDSGFYFGSSKKEKPKPLLSDEFAMQIVAVSKLLPDKLPVASLLLYSKKRRDDAEIVISKEAKRLGTYILRKDVNPDLVKNASLGIQILNTRLIRLSTIPNSPEVWNNMFNTPADEGGLDASHKKVLIDAIGTTLKDPKAKYPYKWLDSQKVIADLREMNFQEEQIEELGSGVTRTMVFLSKAF